MKHLTIRMALTGALTAVCLLFYSAPANAGLTHNCNPYQNIHLDFIGCKQKQKSNGWEGPGVHTHGLLLGYIRGISLTQKQPIFLELGANIVWTHSKDKWGSDDGSYKRTNTFMNVAIPVNASYKFAFSGNDITLIPAFGPNIKFNFYGRSKTTYPNGESDKFKWLKKEGANARIFQFGLNLGLAFNFKLLHVEYTFQPDLTSYVKDGDYKCKTINNQVGIGINF